MVSTELLYNLIFFDFILLDSSSARISHFFLEKLKKNFFLGRLSLFFTLAAFKQCLNLFRFFSKINSKKCAIYFWVNTEYFVEFLKVFLKKISFSRHYSVTTFTPRLQKNISFKCGILLEQYLSKATFFSFFNKNLQLLQSLSTQTCADYCPYKMLADFTDYKKIIFLSLAINSLLKTP